MDQRALSTELEPHRVRLWKLCYRMTGSAADADDLVQDTFARALERPPQDLSRELGPWLTQVAINLSRDQLRRRKRQAYLGPWLPSPIETSGYERQLQPEARYSELESVTYAFLIALEALSATQRAVLILRDVLGQSVTETAATLVMSEPNVKTTHHRARAALQAYDRDREELGPQLTQRTSDMLNRFMIQLMLGNTEAIEDMLADDACARNDGAGEFFAARVPITGSDRIITFHRNVQRDIPPLFQVREINGLPAIVGRFTLPQKGAADDFVFRVQLNREGKIERLDTIVARRKLTHINYDFATQLVEQLRQR